MAHPQDFSLEDIQTCIEDIEDDIKGDDKVMFITWNPNDRKISADDNNYNLKWKVMFKILSHINRCSKRYCILPEVSDNGRLHCHGWLVIKDKIKWIKSVLPLLKRRGFVKISKQKHKGKGLEYYKEDLEETYDIVNCHLYPLTPYTVKGIKKIIKTDLLKYNMIIKKDVTEIKQKDILSLFSLYNK